MEINLATTLAGACSLGALYITGNTLFGKESSQTKNEIFSFFPDSIPVETKNRTYEEASSDEELNPNTETEELENGSLREAKVAPQTISKMCLEEYVDAIVQAGKYQPYKKISTLVTAASLGALAYLILRNNSLSNQQTILSEELESCKAQFDSTQTLNMLRLDSLKPLASSTFFGTIPNNWIQHYINSPSNSTLAEKYSGAAKPDCRYVPFSLDEEFIGLQERCLELSLYQGEKMKGQLELKFTPLEKSIQNKNATSPLFNEINFSCTEQLFRNLTHAEITVNCEGSLKFPGKDTVTYTAVETITANSLGEHNGILAQARYATKESLGSKTHATERDIYVSGKRENAPNKEHFPLLREFMKQSETIG